MARSPTIAVDSFSGLIAACSRNSCKHSKIMKTEATRLRLSLNSHTASDLSHQIFLHLKIVLTHTEQGDDPQLSAFCEITSLLKDEPELWKKPEYISRWYRAFDNFLFDGSLLKHTTLEIAQSPLFVELQLCWSSGTNCSHRVLNRINSRADLAGDRLKQRQEVLKDLVLHQMCHVVFHLYSCPGRCCILSDMPTNRVDATGHESARALLVQVVEDHIARNAVLAEALGLELRTDADDASGDEDDSDIAWDDAWYKD